MQRTKPNIKQNARNLRSNMTDAEQTLWQSLRKSQLNYRFRRQHVVGSFILDFACVETKLAIELDGGQHADSIAQDASRTEWLESQGWMVIRFWNDQVLSELDVVLGVIVGHLPAS